MIILELSKICEIVNGELNKNINIKINNIRTNSKEINNKDLFLIINKGYEYIDEAINNGCIAIITELDIDCNLPIIKVENSIEALGKLAKYIRSLYNIPLIAITGSCGKTTTKELISLILSKKYNVLKSIKNNNNHIGLPNTLLYLNNNYDVIVTELGMNHFNEISYLSKICKPDYSVITNIGSSHIGNLGNKNNILKAKLEIIDGMKDGYLIVNKNDKYLKTIQYKNIIKINKRNLKVKNIKYYNDYIVFYIDKVKFRFNSFKHLLDDLFLAIKIGILFNVDLNLISEAVLEYKSEKGRLNVIKDKYTIIDDSYNSSYESLIGGLKQLKTNQYKVIILGDMLELGKYSYKYHKNINRYLKKIKNKTVLLIGEYTKVIKGIHFNSIDEINDNLDKYLKEDCIIYIKGSRKMNLDKIKVRN